MYENDEKYCINCGRKLHKYDRFCPYCGTDQIRDPAERKAFQDEKRKNLQPDSLTCFIVGLLSFILSGTVIISLILGISAVVLSKSDRKTDYNIYGKILGILGIISSIIVLIFYIFMIYINFKY